MPCAYTMTTVVNAQCVMFGNAENGITKGIFKYLYCYNHKK